jgi:hypothetical protein
MRMSRTPLYRLQGLPAFGTALPIGAACRNWIVRLRLPGLDAQSVTFLDYFRFARHSRNKLATPRTHVTP